MATLGTSWIEVSASALRHNIGVIRSVVAPGTLVAGVVKANAYGHGLAQVLEAAAGELDWLAVHSAAEARQVRALGYTGPLLVMGFVPEWELSGLDADVHLLVSTPEALEWAAHYRQRTGISLPVHVKVETGTHRQGVPVAKVGSFAIRAAKLGLNVVGIATHFANIEDTLNHDFARLQILRFREAVERLTAELKSSPPFIHAACSAAALLFREADFTMVRTGISLYGHWPSRETQLSWILEHGGAAPELLPALSWKALVGQVQHVEKGGTVGYGRTWTALRPTTLAVLPVGYADGYPRALGNRARVLVRGVPAPVVGRVCMNITMVDVTDIPGIGVGDEVVLLGRQDGAGITAEELAGLSGTINYELLARLSAAVPRILVD
jgi:alanine racemase